VSDRSLGPGDWRPLTSEEVRGLEQSVAEVRARRRPPK